MLTASSFAGPRAFARHMLRSGGIPLRPLHDQVMAYGGNTIESILFREACWQIELIAALPNAAAPRHRHLRCASADLRLNGTATYNGREFGAPRGELSGQLKTIGRGEWHGGFAGPQGFVYLSFQQWDGAPDFISQDWEAWTS